MVFKLLLLLNLLNILFASPINPSGSHDRVSNGVLQVTSSPRKDVKNAKPSTSYVYNGNNNYPAVQDEPLDLSTKSRNNDRGEKSKKFDCSQCPKSYGYKDALTKHIKFNHKEKVVCDKCGKVIKSQGGLRYHKETYHQEKTFDCEECGQKFLSNYQRQIHYENQH